MKQIIADFLKCHMDYLEFADQLRISELSASSYIISGDDCRLGKWVEHHQQAFIELAKHNNLDIHVLIEQMEQLDTSPGVYVIISAKGDKSGLYEVAKMEKGRDGVFISEIGCIPNFDEFIKRSALSKLMHKYASGVVEVHDYKSKAEAGESYCSIGWLLGESEDTMMQETESLQENDPKTQKVELTVVGIRNYCPQGEEGLPALFERLPVGTTLYLKINPTGSKYPGSVSVLDGLGTMIGNISKTDRRFIELAIPKDGMLPCKVTGHSMEHLCMYIEAENNVGFKEPYIRKTAAEPGEQIFGITKDDEQLLNLTQLLLTQLKAQNADNKQLLILATEYAKICCTSLDGETAFTRADILRYLRSRNEGSGMFDHVISTIFEDTKDLGRAYNDVKVSVYRSQYGKIFTSAYEKKNGQPSELETYIKGLAYCHGGRLTEEVVKAEVEKLSQQLANEFMGTFVKASETDEDFATALYSLNYSLRAIYVMYTRRIKREYLLSMLETPLTVGDVQTSSPIIDAIREQTQAMKQTAEAMTKIASRPTIQNLVYPQADSTTNVGCDQKQSEFKTFLPPASDVQGQLGSQRSEQRSLTER